jgi:hypothetical protein
MNKQIEIAMTILGISGIVWAVADATLVRHKHDEPVDVECYIEGAHVECSEVLR